MRYHPSSVRFRVVAFVVVIGRTSVESGPIALPAVSASARVTARAPRVGGRAVRASDARGAVRAIGAS